MGKPRHVPLHLPPAFDVALNRRSADWLLRRVAADWLEENGDPTGAACLRWQADERKRPERDRYYEPEGLWAWWVLFRPRPWDRERVRTREVPEPLWNKLPPRVNWFSGFRVYKTRADAEYALRVAWGRLTARQHDAVRAWPGTAPRV